MKRILFVLPILVLLSSCSSQGNAKLDSLLKVANSTSAKNLTKIASSTDPKAAAKAMLERKRSQWERDPMQTGQGLESGQARLRQSDERAIRQCERRSGAKGDASAGSKTYVKYTSNTRAAPSSISSRARSVWKR